MNLSELNTEIEKVIARAFRDGLAKGKLNHIEIVGCLESHKASVLGHGQAMAMAHHAANQTPIIHVKD